MDNTPIRFKSGQKVVQFNQDPDTDVKIGTVGVVINEFYYPKVNTTSLHIKLPNRIIASSSKHWKPVSTFCDLFE